ncbi:MAG: sigma-70 family RNA polymerase sigma factor [Saprospiraceae bacterium]|nr:sigma-70 family RNA polymerase sigma factor [Saprospiraceae bacterium]
MSVPLATKREQTITTAMNTYGKRLFSFIRSRVPSNADAEDILQDVWFQFSKVLQLETVEQVSGWLFRVARNKVTDRYRKNQPDLLDDLQETGEEGLFIKEILLADPLSPGDEELKELFWQALFDALDELPEAQRQAFVWNELEDQTFQEMANRSGESIKTWISRKRYAVLHLRKKLQSLYEEFMSD